MKTTSLTTLVAAAGIFVGNSAYAPANAADLGGGCCADLEERVAELEATTARKGNRVVSLQIYGQVNKALLVWDDGVDSDAYVVDNDYSMSRLGFKGSATMKPGWTAGYNIEIGVRTSPSSGVSQGDDDATDSLLIRQNHVYIDSERIGRITLGRASAAADGINEINLGGSLESSYDNYGSFVVRDNFGDDFFTISDFVSNLDGPRADIVRYDSPSLYGFILSASWGEDDYADVTLRYKQEWNSVRIAAGIGYQSLSETADVTDPFFVDDPADAFDSASTLFSVDQEILSGSISIMHVPTGLYGMFAAGSVEYDAGPSLSLDDGDFYYVQVGLDRRWLPYGSTTIYGEYGNYDQATSVASYFGLGADLWGLGIVQRFDSAALEVYASARFYDFGNASYNVTNFDNPSPGVDRDAVFEDFGAVLIGSRIKF